MKTCSKCKEEKELSDFYKGKSGKDGYSSQCKLCTINYSNNRYQQDKEQWIKKTTQRNKQDENRSERMATYFQQNKEQIYEKRRKYIKERYHNDPLFRLTLKTRTTISNALRKTKHRKTTPTQTILGCSFKELKEHLESQFEPWMNWENMGGKQVNKPNTTWEVDHIIPISSAKTEEETIKLNHYTNLRPLCSYKNRYIKRNNH